jgi:tripartite-type tricarboxylate transporter receptor subunit TctC
MVVPFATEGEADFIGRIVAQRLSETLGKPVIVENVGGAGGATGTSRVAKAAPDGYQFLLSGRGPFVGGQLRVTDFATVGLIAETPHLLVGRKDCPPAI